MQLASGHTILWRLSDETGEGPDVVSIVLSKPHSNNIAEIEIETDIISAPMTGQIPETPVDIAWDRKDLDLFMTLLRNTFPADALMLGSKPLELDLHDASVVRIMHVVAAARFATPYPVDGVITDRPIAVASPTSYAVGEQISIDTIDGFKSCIVVGVDEFELNCVLLDEIVTDNDGDPHLDRHDMVILNKEFALPASFSLLTPSGSDRIH